MVTSIRLYGNSWCYDCRCARDFLHERQLTFEEIDVEARPEAAEFVKGANGGKCKVPTFDVGGNVFSCSPFDAERMARELGIQ